MGADFEGKKPGAVAVSPCSSGCCLVVQFCWGGVCFLVGVSFSGRLPMARFCFLSIRICPCISGEGRLGGASLVAVEFVDVVVSLCDEGRVAGGQEAYVRKRRRD